MARFACIVVALFPFLFVLSNSDGTGGTGGDCGVKCVYAVLRLYKKEVDFRMLAPKYITSRHGSSIGDLVDALQSSGLHVYPVKNLRMWHLRKSTLPIILHMRSERGAGPYDHFQLLLPSKDRSHLLYDPSSGLHKLDMMALLLRWQGVGIVVSQQPAEIKSLYPRATL